MRKYKLFVAIFVLCALIIGVSGSFADHTNVKLGMTIDEVKEITGKDVISTSSGGKTYTKTYLEETIGKYNTIMHLNFDDDGVLVEKYCEFRGHDNARDKSLFKAYQKKYGKPIGDSSTWKKNTKIPNEIGTILCLADYREDDSYSQELIKEAVLEGYCSFMVWEPDEDTMIILYEDFGTLTIRYILQTYLYDVSIEGV